MFGPRPGPIHLENVLIHALSSMLLFFFLSRTTGAAWPAMFAAAIFAVHPAHVESVAWIAERKDVLSGLFFMLALLAYLAYARTRSTRSGTYLYFATALLMIAGLLAKQTLVTFPFVLLLFDCWPLGRKLAWKSLLVEKIPLIVAAIAASIVAFVAQRAGGAVIDLRKLPFTERMANAAVSYVRYLGKFFWPDHLSVFYPRLQTLPIISVVISVVTLLAITGGCWWVRRCAPSLIVGWLFFLGTLVPVIGLVQIGGQSMADRYLYLPMIGPIIMVVWGTQELTRQANQSIALQRITAAAGVIAVLLASAVTVHQLQYWRDTRTLFEHALSIDPKNAVAHVQLALLETSLGDVPSAKQYYQQAIIIDPTNFVAEFNFANLLLHEHQPHLAADHYQKAASLQPGLAKVENNWGISLMQLHQLGEAFEHFRKAKQIDPGFADAHYNLGEMFLQARRWDAAEAEFRATLELIPGHAGATEGLREVRSARTATNGGV